MKRLGFWLAFTALAVVCLAPTAFAARKWTSGVTSMSNLTPEEFKQYLNLDIQIPDDPTPYMNNIEVPKDMPRHLDWRDIDGRNFMTPIKDQHPCGTCATFSSAGAFEANFKIALDNDFIVPDISEEHLYACEGPLPYTLFHPMIYLQKSGGPDERCFPYDCDSTFDRPECSETCPDWANRVSKLTDWRMMMWPSPEKLMAALQDGPIVAGFQVRETFQNYTGGIYDPAGGGPIMGGHGVVIVGYDADEQYWICKNSWGPDWGEDGYFKYVWETGFLAFGYQAMDFAVTVADLCGGNDAPEIGLLTLMSGDQVLAEDAGLEIMFDYADVNANLAGGELWYAIDDGAAQRYAEPLVKLVGTDVDQIDEVPTFAIQGPFGPGEHTLHVWVADLCAAESNELTATFTVEGEVPGDDDDTTDDDDSTGDDDDDDDNDDQSGDDDDDDDDDDNGSCGG